MEVLTITIARPDPHVQLEQHRQVLETYLEKALKRIAACLDSQNDKIAFQAAKWIAEMLLGKPTQPIQAESSSRELATELARALREAIALARLDRPPEPKIIEGQVRVLGVQDDK